MSPIPVRRTVSDLLAKSSPMIKPVKAAAPRRNPAPKTNAAINEQNKSLLNKSAAFVSPFSRAFISKEAAALMPLNHFTVPSSDAGSQAGGLMGLLLGGLGGGILGNHMGGAIQPKGLLGSLSKFTETPNKLTAMSTGTGALSGAALGLILGALLGRRVAEVDNQFQQLPVDQQEEANTAFAQSFEQAATEDINKQV